MFRKMIALGLAAGLWTSAPTTAKAEQFETITNSAEFLGLVNGKILTVKSPFYLRNSIRLTVRPNGGIQGRALSYELTGKWSWQDGFFCREMDWEGTNIPFNCQQVQFNGSRVRFTSDRGAGDKAEFALD